MMRNMDPSLVGSLARSRRDEVTFSFSYHFSNRKLLTSLHLIFKEEVEDTSDGGAHDSEEEQEQEPEQEQEQHKEEEGHYEGEARHYEDVVVGVTDLL
jgi:hypothetical protein